MTRRLYRLAFYVTVAVGLVLEVLDSQWGRLVDWLERKSQ